MQPLELDLSREVERRLTMQAGALAGLLSLAQRVLEMSSDAQIEAGKLGELIREGEKFFGRLKQLQEGLLPLRDRWLAENPGHERRQAIEDAAHRVQTLITRLAGIQEDVLSNLETARSAVVAEIEGLPGGLPKAGTGKKAGRLLDCRG